MIMVCSESVCVYMCACMCVCVCLCVCLCVCVHMLSVGYRVVLFLPCFIIVRITLSNMGVL